MAKAEEDLNTSQELSVVCQSDIVFSHPGDDVALSCHLKPAISAASMEIQWWHKEDPVFRYKDGQVTVNIDFEGRASLPLENLHNGNVSLTLRDVRTSQKGLYVCEVTDESQSIQNTVFLHISSVDFSLVAPSDTLSADPGSDVILPVHLSPETSAVSMEIRWFKGTELIYQYMNGQEMTNNDFENRLSLSSQELRSGNLAVTLRNVQQSDSGVYTCKVFHDGCQKRGVVHLKVKEIERVNHLRSVLKQAHEDIIQQRVKLNETIKLLEETLNYDDRSCRHINSIEGMPPFMQDQSKQERCDIEDGRAGSTYRPTSGSMEGIPPLMEGERGSLSTIQEENTATEQELSSPDTSSQVRQRLEVVSLTERATQNQQSPEATMQSTQERRQETVAAEQERSSPAVQPQTQEREETSQSRSAQTLEWPEGRGQRRRETRERKCQIL